jgi:hypothetical protein
MIDYAVFSMEAAPGGRRFPGHWEWDLFISSFNDEERVQSVFRRASSARKHWLILPEYAYRAGDPPGSTNVFTYPHTNEADFMGAYGADAEFDPATDRICIDSTGFIVHHLLGLLQYLVLRGVRRLDVLYAAPISYRRGERTVFVSGPIVGVRPISGFEGSHVPNQDLDLLIIGTGYDSELIRRVAEHKSAARKRQLFGWPSLQADMYQENIIGAEGAADSVGGAASPSSWLFAPAMDPFTTAQVLHDVTERERLSPGVTNLYLAPTGTKAQALGFAVYYLTECKNAAASLIVPLASHYPRETSQGLSTVWRYSLEF